MPSELTVRRYRSADDVRVRDLHEAATRDVDGFVEGVPEPDLDDVESAYLDAGGEFLVGVLDQRIVAMGAFRPAEGYVTEFVDVDESTAEVKRMRVDPAHQRRGFGQRIYDALERRARAAGFTGFVLDTTAEQVAARRFYETNGFDRVDCVRVEAFDEPFDLVLYRKSFDEGA